MKKVLLTLCVVFVFVTACNTKKETAISQAKPSIQKVPFSLSIVPETSRGEGFGSSIEMAHDTSGILRCTYEFFIGATGRLGTLEQLWLSNGLVSTDECRRKEVLCF